MAQLTDKDYSQFVYLLDAADTMASSEWDMEFVESMKSRHHKFGRSVLVSARQFEMLEKISGE